MNKTLGIFAVIIASVLWGTTGTAATFAPSLSPLLIGAVAMGIGGILQGVIALSTIVHCRYLLWKNRYYLIGGAIAVAIYPLAFYTSMRFSGITVGTIVSIGSAPILSVIIEYISDDFRVTKQWMLGAGFGLLGIILLCFSENEQGSVSYPHTTIGILLGLVAGLTYALYSWSARQLMLKGVTAKSSMGATFGCGGLLLMPILFMIGAPLFDSLTNIVVASYMALIPMFLGYLCYGFGLSKISASTATTITLLEPVIAAILAMIIVGETLSLIGLLGIMFVLFCLVLISIPFKSNQGVLIE